jgi:lipopolysaccharide export system protein LptA
MKRVVALLFALGCAGAWALETPPVEAPAADPAEADLTVITSEKLTFDYAKHYAIFEQNVVVTDPEMKILADKLTVFFDDKNKAKTVKAEGQVYLLQADKKSKSDFATYDVASGEIVLTGTPQVTRGRDTLTGDTITFWRNENKMVCKPRARLVIYPDSESKSALGGNGKK